MREQKQWERERVIESDSNRDGDSDSHRESDSDRSKT